MSSGVGNRPQPSALMDIYAHLHEKDRVYFRETRENRFGKELEPASADRDTRVVCVPSISRANAGHARCSTLLRWRYPELCRLHRFRLFPMGALHQRIPAAHSGRPRRCVARSTAWGIRWFGAGRAGIRSMTKFFRGGGCAVSSRHSHRRDERRAQLTGLLDASGTALRLAAPLVDLLVRFSLAKVFFAPGMLPSSHLFQFVQT